MALFRKKPVTVEAEQFWPDKRPWPDGVYEGPSYDDLPNPPLGADGTMTPRQYRRTFLIDTLEGPAHSVSPGDWIITGVRGEKYPCKPDIFAETYEEVEPRFT